MNSVFPNFIPLGLNSKDDLYKIQSKFDTYSDFSFVNMYAWDIDDSTKISWLNNNMVIQMTDYMDKDRKFFTLFGDNKIDETLEELFKITSHLELIPGFVIEAIRDPSAYAVAEDRSSFDYMYKVSDIAQLKGKKYSKKRNHINKITSQLGKRISTTTVSEIGGPLMDELMSTFHRWCEHTKQPLSQYELEIIALQKLLRVFSEFNIYITICRIDGEIEGFSINEILNSKSAICHFEKSINKDHKGLNAYLINQAAKFLDGKVKIVNWEQDLGLKGLKKTKSSYHPVRQNRKYWLSKPQSMTQR